MKVLVALLIVFVPLNTPFEDQRCMNPAYEHSHVKECKSAIHPGNYSDKPKNYGGDE